MRYLVLGLFIVISHGCKKVKKLTEFNMDYTETVVIPSSTGINSPFSFISPDIESNSATTFEINDTRKDLIEQIVLEELIITIVSPSNADFSFLKSVVVYLSAPGLSEIEIASHEAMNNNQIEVIELETTDNDLKEYIKKDSFSIRLKTVTDEFLTSDHTIKVYSNFFVDAKLIK